jgi:hypothetical protein
MRYTPWCCCAKARRWPLLIVAMGGVVMLIIQLNQLVR